MKPSLKTKDLNMDESYLICSLTLEWCKKFFTPPHVKRRKELVLMIYHSPTLEHYGDYCERNNWLAINTHLCSTVKDLIRTTIHEYVHYCQDLKNYCHYNKTVGYYDNPLELEANENEKYYTNCWKSIKPKL